jgi:drug/metabolite transporter (DMT)-like permease
LGLNDPLFKTRRLPIDLDCFAPALFVLVWSTGFIVAKFGLPYAPTLTFLLLRFAGVLLLLLPSLLLVPAPWPNGLVLHIAVAGVLVQAGYLSGVWSAIKLGTPAGLAALIVGLQPMLTALAARWVGERLSVRQWLGLVIGLIGVGLVVKDKLTFDAASYAGIVLCVLALVSITAGTLYQKRFCPRFDLRSGALIQFAASIALVLPLALWLEDLDVGLSQVIWTPQFIGALCWSVFALSIGAMFLLYALIRKNAATHVSSLMYLTPPVTALIAWVLFGESFTLAGAIGILLTATGVAFVVRK